MALTLADLEIVIAANTAALLKGSSDVQRLKANVDKLSGSSEKSGKVFEKAANKVARSSKKASDAQRQMTDRMTDLAKSVQVALGPLSGVAARITAMTSLANRNTIAIAGLISATIGLSVATAAAIKIATAAEKQLAQLDAQIKLLGNDTELTSAKVNKMARSLAEATLTNAKSARAAASVILQFKNIPEQFLQPTLKLSMDLATVFGQDLPQAARRLGRALNDPVRGMNLLKNLGVELSLVQKEQVTRMIAVGDRAKAVAFILDQLNTKMGGAAEGAGKSLAGALDTLGDRFVALQEDIFLTGDTLGLITAEVNKVSDVILDLKKNSTAMQNVLAALGGTAVAVAKSVAFLAENLDIVLSVITGLVSAKMLPLFLGLLIKITSWTGKLAKAVALLGAATGLAGFTKGTAAAAASSRGFLSILMKLIKSVKVFAATPWGIAITGALAAVSAGYLIFAKNADIATEAQERLANAAERFGSKGNTLRESFLAATPQRRAFEKRQVTGGIARRQALLGNVTQQMGSPFMNPERLKNLSDQAAELRAQISGLEIQLASMGTVTAPAVNSNISDLTNTLQTLTGKLIPVIQKTKEYEDNSAALAKVSDILSGKAGASASTIGKMRTELLAVIPGAKSAEEALLRIKEALDKNFDKGITDQIRDMTMRLQEMAQATGDNAREVFVNTEHSKALALIWKQAGGVIAENEKLLKRYTKELEANKKAAKEAFDAQSLTASTKALDKQLRGLEAVGRQLGLSGREQAAYNAHLAATEKLMSAAKGDIARYNELLDIHKEKLDKIPDAARKAFDTKEFNRVITQMKESIQDAFADMFTDIFRNGIKSFKDLGDVIFDIMARTAAEVATMFIFNPSAAITLLGGTAAGGTSVGGTAPGGIRGSTGFIGGGGVGAAGGGGAISGSGFLSAASLLGIGQSATLGKLGVGLAGKLGFGATGAARFGNAGLNAPFGMLGGFGASLLGLGDGGIGSLLGGAAGGLAGGALGGSALGGSVMSMLGLSSALGGPIGAAVGGFLGTVIPGLFGSKPKIKKAISPLTFGPGGVGTADPIIRRGGDVGRSEAGALATADLLNLILDQMGAQIKGLPGRVAFFSKIKGAEQIITEFQAGTGVGINKTFAPTQEGIQAAIEDLTFQSLKAAAKFTGQTSAGFGNILARETAAGGAAVGFEGLDPMIITAIQRSAASDLAGLLDDIDFANFVLDLEEVPDGVTQAGEAIKALNEAFDSNAQRALQLGLSLDTLEAAREREIKALTTNFDKGVRRAILGFTNPLLEAFDNLIESQADRLKEAEVLGANMVELEKLSGLERQALITQFTDQTIGSLGRIIDIAQRLRDTAASLFLGNLSPLSPLEKLTEARRQFNEAIELAQGGDTQAALRAQALSSTFLEASRGYNASTAAFVQDFNAVQAGLTGVADTLESEGIATNREGFRATIEALQQIDTTLDTKLEEVRQELIAFLMQQLAA